MRPKSTRRTSAGEIALLHFVHIASKDARTLSRCTVPVYAFAAFTCDGVTVVTLELPLLVARL